MLRLPLRPPLRHSWDEKLESYESRWDEKLESYEHAYEHEEECLVAAITGITAIIAITAIAASFHSLHLFVMWLFIAAISSQIRRQLALVLLLV